MTTTYNTFDNRITIIDYEINKVELERINKIIKFKKFNFIFNFIFFTPLLLFIYNSYIFNIVCWYISFLPLIKTFYEVVKLNDIDNYCNKYLFSFIYMNIVMLIVEFNTFTNKII